MSQKHKTSHKHKAQPVHVEPEHHDDEIVVVPKGQSRLKFFLIMGAMLFVLVIFTVGPQVESELGSIFSGGGGNPTELTWVHPDTGERIEVDRNTVWDTMRKLDQLASIGAYLPLDYRTEQRRARVKPDDVAMYYLLDRLAADAGVEISNTEFRERLASTFGTSQNLQLAAGRLGLTVPTLESQMREVMRGQKLKQLMMLAVSIPDSEAVLEAWKEAHPEYRFELVSLPTADFEDAARAELPDDATLQAWYDELPDFRKRQYFTEPKVRFQLAWLPLGAGFDSTALLEKYPVPEGTDLDDQARTYYNMNSHVRFQVKKDDEETEAGRETGPEDSEAGAVDDEQAEAGDAGENEDPATQDPATEDPATEDPATEDPATEDPATEDPATEDPTSQDPATEDSEPAATEDTETEDTATEDPEQDDPSATQEPERWYEDYEDVEELAKAEAPIQSALDAFMQDLRKRSDAGEEFDFRAEAEALGLTVVVPEEPLTRTEIEEMDGWGGRFVAGQLSVGTPDRWLQRVVIETDAMITARVDERIPGAQPPIEDMRDDLLEEWVKERARELAVEQLESLRDSFGTRPASEEGEEEEPFLPTVDADTFRTVVTEAGYEVQERPYMERMEIPGDDFASASKSDLHVRGNPLYHDLEPGQVPEALANAQGDTAFLVRFVDERPAPIDEVTPAELERLRQVAVGEARQAFDEKCFFPRSEWIKKRYQMHLRTWDEETEEEEVAEEA